MRMTKILSVVTLFLLACQLICGFSMVNNPRANAEGGNPFHMLLGIVILVCVVAVTVSAFRQARKKA
jgi:hypothetical protein